MSLLIGAAFAGALLAAYTLTCAWPALWLLTRLLGIGGPLRTLRIELAPWFHLGNAYQTALAWGLHAGWRPQLGLAAWTCVWWWITRDDDTDDRWKRRREALGSRVRDVGGRLTVEPATFGTRGNSLRRALPAPPLPHRP